MYSLSTIDWSIYINYIHLQTAKQAYFHQSIKVHFFRLYLQKKPVFKPAFRMNCIAIMYCIRELMLYDSFLLFSLEYCEQDFLCFYMNNINIYVKQGATLFLFIDIPEFLSHFTENPTSVHKRIDRAFNNPLNPHMGIITKDPTVNNSGIKSMVIISVLLFSIYFLLFKTLHIDLLVFYKTRLSVCIRKN